MTSSAQNLNIAIIPLDPLPCNKEANLNAAADIIRTLRPGTDIAVLPELFSTGFFTDKTIVESSAEPIDGDTVYALKELACSCNVAICGSFICNEAGNIFNRGFFIEPDGRIHTYDKHHLFRMGGEPAVFAAGNEASPVIDYKGWKISLAICYDLRFPVWNRNAGLRYDALIIPANWPHSRLYAWKHLLIARAIENQAFVIGCNRSGRDDFGEYLFEDSFAFDHWGKDISERIDSDGVIYATLDSRIHHDRDRFCPWRDADEFTVVQS